MFQKIRNIAAVSAAAVAASAATAGPPNLLSNGGFETAGGGSVFADWNDFGGNITFDILMPIADAVSAVMFGQFPGVPGQNDTIFWQDFAVTGGNEYEFSIIAEQRTGDLLTPNSFCLVAWQYDTDQDLINGGIIQDRVIFIGDNRDQDGDTFPDQIFPPADTPTTITARSTAPATAAAGRVLFVFIQIDNAPGSIFFDNASVTDLGTFDDSDPWNLSFEQGLDVLGQAVPGWFATSVNFARNPDAPTDGERALLQFGNFPGDGSLNDNIVRSTTFDAFEGEMVTVTADVQHLDADPVAVDNIAFLNVEFYDGLGALVDASGVTALESTDPTDTPTTATVMATVPATAVEAAVVLGYQQVNEGSGAVHWDNVTIDVQPAPAGCDGDANGDQTVDVNDISFVLFRLGNSVATCGEGDANGDAIVDVNDISYVLFRLGTCNAGGPCP